MSGGFFRGTSADQDTRFSNKQAKLMKSQKFAPELENLVDMSKVKMDVMKPWIANRVTELLGFEDEVLINFIYSLLDVKEVNGKEVQIQLTGFMEKNTGKFMKELWTLLLSAQKNESGVPQQFLDAKEEETRKKQAEMDRITIELQKKKEKENRELERELSKKMDGGFGTKGSNVAVEPTSKQMLLKDSSGHPKDEKKTYQRNGMSGRNRVSRSHSAERSPSSPGRSPSHIRKSISNSRSYSGGGQKSRSVSRSPKAWGHKSPRKRPVTPVRGRSSSVTPSPPRRFSYSRRTYRLPSRSISRSPVRGRLHSPVRRRRSSPMQERSSSPIRHRSPSPTLLRRNRSRSPIRRRGSPSPLRRRRSPSPLRRRRSPSPLRRRRSPSPLRRRRSPAVRRRRSPSPVRRGRRSPLSSRHRYQRSSSTPPRRSASPVEDRSPVLARKRAFPRRSPSQDASSSPSPIPHSPSSQMTKGSSKEHLRSPLPSPGERIRNQEKLSPVSHQTSDSLRSPQRAVKDQQHQRNQGPDLSPSQKRSPLRTKLPPVIGNRSVGIDRRSPSPFGRPERQRRQIARDVSKSPPQNGREQKPHHHNPQTNKEGAQADHTWEGRDCTSMSSHRRSGNEANIVKQQDSLVELHYKDEHSTEPRSRSNYTESRKKDQEVKRGMTSGTVACPETIDGCKSPAMHKDSQMRDKQHTSLAQVDKKSGEHNHVCLINVKDSDRDHKSVLIEKGDGVNAGGAINSGSEESDKHRPEKKEKRKHKRSHRQELASDDDSYDSEYEDKKEAKKRRKEEKKSRKEEKRRRREEQRRRKEERRAEKLKFKDRNEEDSPGDEDSGRKNLCPIDDEETHSEQKKLEIELRNKALESLKAKKGISR